MADTTRDLGEAQDVAAARASSRLMYFFDVPEEIAKQTGVTIVGMVELTSSEELMCAERSRGSNARLGLEVVKESVRRVNGRAINTGDGSTDAFWDSPKPGMSYLRQLLLSAYNDIHNPQSTEVQAFLKSRRAQV